MFFFLHTPKGNAVHVICTTCIKIGNNIKTYEFTYKTTFIVILEMYQIKKKTIKSTDFLSSRRETHSFKAITHWEKKKKFAWVSDFGPTKKYINVSKDGDSTWPEHFTHNSLSHEPFKILHAWLLFAHASSWICGLGMNKHAKGDYQLGGSKTHGKSTFRWLTHPNAK